MKTTFPASRLPSLAVFLGLVCSNASHAAQTVLVDMAPVGHYTINTDTVVDNKTGLTWQRSPAPSASAPATYTQAAAATYCAALSLGGYSSGWRVPTANELLSIVDDHANYPSIDSVAFPNTPANSFYWTSTPQFLNASNNVVVRLGLDGGMATTGTSVYYVYCVH